MLREITRKLNNTSSSTMPQYFSGVLYFHECFVWNKRNVYDFMDFYFDIFFWLLCVEYD